MFTRNSVAPAYAHDPGQPFPMSHMHPAHRQAPAPERGGFVGGGVVNLHVPVGPGGTGYGYLGMDITDAKSWPRPYNPQPTRAWFTRWQAKR